MIQFSEAVNRAFEKVRKAGRGARARLRVEKASEKRAARQVTLVEQRKRNRASGAKMTRHQRKAARRRQLGELDQLQAQFLAQQMAKAAAGEIGTPDLQRNVRAAIINATRARIQRETPRKDFPSYATWQVEINRKLDAELESLRSTGTLR